VRGSLREAKIISDQSIALEPPRRRRNTVSLPNSISLGRQLNIGPRRLRYPTIGLFYQQITPWSRREVPLDRKVGLRLNHLGTKTKAIFSSACYTGVDRVSVEEDITKTRLVWQVGELVGRAGAIRHRIPSSNFYQGSGPS
jgi:hypothetical protein